MPETKNAKVQKPANKKPKATENVYQALVRIQGKLKAPKSQENKFGGFKYRSCADILEAVKPLLGKMYLVISDDLMMVGDRYYIKATAILSDGEESIRNNAFAREAAERKGMDASQITGAASSYARKYALNGLFAIDDTKDADVDVESSAVAKENLLNGKEMKDIASILQDINNAKNQEALQKIGSEIDKMGFNDKQIAVLREAWGSKSKKFAK